MTIQHEANVGDIDERLRRLHSEFVVFAQSSIAPEPGKTALFEPALIDACPDRFSDYKESRIEDAQRAHDAVHRIADNIPFGQPILVGHHSERHARKDAERIENTVVSLLEMEIG
jgi:hypothetical protein